MNLKNQAVALFVIAAFLAATSARGGQERQEKPPQNSGVPFNLSAPGARSLGMGGAFIGLADDATAAFTNPAGLTSLAVSGTEVALEVRSWQYKTLFIDGGHIEGAPTHIGLDTTEGLKNGKSESSTSGLSFISFGYVLPGGVALALYRHELANYQSATESQGFFLGEGFASTPLGREVNPDLIRVSSQRTRDQLKVDNYGLSAAYELEFPRASASSERESGTGMRPGNSLSLGVGVSYFHLDLRRRIEDFGLRNRDNDRAVGGFFGPGDFLPDNAHVSFSEDGDDTALGLTVGCIWKTGRNREWSLGGIYRRGAEFRTERDTGGGTFTVPDVWGLGVAYHVADGRTQVTFDYDHVRHSQELKDQIPLGFPDPRHLRVKDADELHAGLERTFQLIGTEVPATLRVGAWYDPSHELDYFGTQGEQLTGVGKDVIHATGGLGMVFRENFQIDAAFDFSELQKIFSLSIVKFF